jgi:hypothetical protein
MTEFKATSVKWETDRRKLDIDADFNDFIGDDFTVNSLITFEPNLEIPEHVHSGYEDRPHSPQPPPFVEDQRLYLHGLTWGYDVIKALDSDDPEKLISSLLRYGAFTCHSLQLSFLFLIFFSFLFFLPQQIKPLVHT